MDILNMDKNNTLLDIDKVWTKIMPNIESAKIEISMTPPKNQKHLFLHLNKWRSGISTLFN